MDEKTAVTSICWIPRGKCRAKPLENDERDEGELAQVHDNIMGDSSSSRPAAAAATANAVIGEGLEEFDLDKYDDEDDGGMQFFSILKSDGELVKEKDPYMTGDPESESGSEGNYEIRPEDQVFIAASCEEDLCQLELYVYDEDEASMFVHHDLLLGAYPLCLEWLGGTAETSEGSFAVVGLIDHSIQIWDLDRKDPLLPAQVLGAPAAEKKAKKGSKNKKKKNKAHGHDGAVLCIHGSEFNRSVLASGSADQTVKVWDVRENACVHSYDHHSDKVQCTRWHPTEQAVMLTAAFDRHLGLLDVRQPGQVAMVELPAEAECAIWSRHKPFECIGSADNGCVACYDVRKVAAKAPAKEQVLWSTQAHDVACTAVQDAPAPNLLVTTGLDGEAKVWSIAGPTPQMVFSKDLQAGPLFACQARPDAAALFCFGGKCPVIWDLSSEQVLTDAFKLDDMAIALKGNTAM